MVVGKQVEEEMAANILLRQQGELRDVLESAVRARGTSFRDYRDAKGQRGRFAEQLQAYGRGGQPCLRGGTTLILTHEVDGRATVICSRCQS